MPLSVYIEDPRELDGLTPQCVLPTEVSDYTSVAVEQDEQPTPEVAVDAERSDKYRRKSPYRLHETAEEIAADVQRACAEENEDRVAVLFKKAGQLTDSEIEHRSAHGSEVAFDVAWDLDPTSYVNALVVEFRADRFILARKALGAGTTLFHLFVFLYQDGHRYEIAPRALLANPLVREIRRTVGRMYRKHQLHVLRYVNPVRRHHSEIGTGKQSTDQKSRKRADSIRVWLCPEEAERRNHA